MGDGGIARMHAGELVVARTQMQWPSTVRRPTSP